MTGWYSTTTGVGCNVFGESRGEFLCEHTLPVHVLTVEVFCICLDAGERRKKRRNDVGAQNVYNEDEIL